MIAVFSMVVSGLKILLAAGNPAAISEARERLMGSLLGILLLLTSFIILRTINTELVAPEISDLGPKPGVYYISDSDWYDENDNGSFDDEEDYNYYQAKKEVWNVYLELTSYDGWDTDSQLFYKCTATAGNPGKTLLVWIYNEVNYEIDRGTNGTREVTTIKIPCSRQVMDAAGNPLPTKPIIATLIAGDGTLTPANANTIDVTSVSSFIWEYEEPGVYFYLTEDCTGISSYAQKSNGAIKPFDDLEDESQKAKSMKILSGTGLRQKYGVILSKGSNAIYGEGGQCTSPVIQTTAGYGQCIKIADDNTSPLYVESTPGAPYVAASAYILNVETQNVNSLGGITIQSKNYRKNITPADFAGLRYWWPRSIGAVSNLVDLVKSGTIYRAENAGNDCTSAEETCLQSISFSRNAYYIILYAKNYQANTDQRCDVFIKPITNVKSIDLLQNNRGFYQIYIIPFAS